MVCKLLLNKTVVFFKSTHFMMMKQLVMMADSLIRVLFISSVALRTAPWGYYGYSRNPLPCYNAACLENPFSF